MIKSHFIIKNKSNKKIKNYIIQNNNINKYLLFILIKAIIIIYLQINGSKYDYNINFLKIFISLNNSKRPKVSVFLPIFNKEQYIIESLKNIKNQTLKDIEIIAVNDGSTDNSLKIIKKLSKNDNRIKIVNNDRNHGLLYSRSMGIINSTGEYLINLDPDDLFSSPNNLEFLYHKAKTLKVDTITFLLKQKRRQTKKHYRQLYEINKTNYLEIMRDKTMTNKFIKREIILRCYNDYKDKIFGGKWNYHEDNIWSILIHKYSKSMIFIKDYIYLYLQNKESLMHNRYNIQEAKNVIYRFEKIQNIFDYKNTYSLDAFLYNIKKVHKIIKNNVELRKKIINKLNIYICKNNNSFLYEVKNIRNLLFNNKIVMIGKFDEKTIERNLIYLTIYHLIQKYINRKIVIINLDNENKFFQISNFIYTKDIIVIFDEKKINFLENYLKNNLPKNKKLLFLGNDYIINSKEYFYFNKISNNNQYYIKNYMMNVSKYFNYQRYNSNNNILIIFNANLTQSKKKILNKKIIDNLTGNITFIENWKMKNISKNMFKLINLLTNYKLIITDDDEIMKISALNFLSCIFIKNSNYHLNDDIKNLDYIKYINNINELEVILLKMKNNYIEEKNIFNDFFFLLKNDIKN